MPGPSLEERIAWIRLAHDGDVDSVGTRRGACVCFSYRRDVVDCAIRDLLLALDRAQAELAAKGARVEAAPISEALAERLRPDR